MTEQQNLPMITITLMGREHQVPAGLTIMTAIEHAGYKLVRGVGCRAGFCGACPTIFRKANDYKLYTALACQTLIEEGMNLVQIPFVPVSRKSYNLSEVEPSHNIVLRYYPEIARCVACNTCTRACPQNISVMDYIQAALRGDIARAAEISFDCIQCGICSTRCPADIKHYPVAQLVRRIYGTYILPRSSQLGKRVRELEKGLYQEEMATLTTMSLTDLRKLYEERTLEKVEFESKDQSALKELGTAQDPVDFQDDMQEYIEGVTN